MCPGLATTVSCTLTPPPAGTAVFPYTITDAGTGLNASAYVHITIMPPAGALPATDDYYVGVYNTPRLVNATEGILRNDGPGPTNGTLVVHRIITAPPTADGNVTQLHNATGSFVFTPARGFSGNTSFVYGARLLVSWAGGASGREVLHAACQQPQ